MELEKLIKRSCEYYKLDYEMFFDRKHRPGEMITCRHMVYYQAYHVLNLSKLHIARICTRNHASIISGIKKVEDQMEIYPELKSQIIRFQKDVIEPIIVQENIEMSGKEYFYLIGNKTKFADLKQIVSYLRNGETSELHTYLFQEIEKLLSAKVKNLKKTGTLKLSRSQTHVLYLSLNKVDFADPYMQTLSRNFIEQIFKQTLE